MQNCYRWLISVTTAALCALIYAGDAPRAQSGPRPWQVGDVFVGVGSDLVPNGKYLVFDRDGTYRETLVDTSTQYPITTGCMVRPFETGLDESLFTTNFFGATRDGWGFYPAGPDAIVGSTTGWGFDFGSYDTGSYVFGPTVTKFGTVDHTAAKALTIDHPSVMAAESVVFDKQGNFYVGTIVGPFSEDEPWGYIFKFSSTNQLLATYQVPNGNKGADWIDLAPDNKTLYYTSEGTTIHKVVMPDTPPPSPSTPVLPVSHETIQIHNKDSLGVDQPVGGRTYAFRLLQSLPDGSPSGFLVAMHSGVKRLDPTGLIVRSYDVAAPTGTSFFGLNIAPDGKTFWTATEQPDLCCFQTTRSKGQDVFLFDADGYLMPTTDNPPRAYLYQFHLATGELLKGPIDLTTATGTTQNVHSAKGLCVKREYTAAFNTCAITDTLGRYIDQSGNLVSSPVYQECPRLELCSGNSPGDDDGDGLDDERDPDCARPGSPSFVLSIPDTTTIIGDTVTAHPTGVTVSNPLAVSPLGLVLTYTAGGLPTGIVINAATGVMSGTPSGPDGAYPVTVTATDTGGRTAKAYFTWTIVRYSGNMAPELFPNPTASPTGFPDPFTVTVLRPHQITYLAKDREDQVWVAASYKRISDTGYTPGLPPGYTLLNPTETFGRSPELPVPTGYALLGLVPNPSPGIPTQILLGTIAPTHPTVEGVYEVRMAIMDNPQGSTWGTVASCIGSTDPECSKNAQIAGHDWLRAAQTGSFVVTIVNQSPSYNTTAIANITQLIGTPVPLRTVTASDPDRHYPLTFTLGNNPAGTGIGITSSQTDTGGNTISQTATINGAPTVEVTNATVTVSAKDFAGKAVATPLSFTWTVYNNAPTITNCPASRSDVASTGSATVTLAGTQPAEDLAAGQTLTSAAAPGLGGWELVSGPSWVSIDRNSGAVTATDLTTTSTKSASVSVIVRDNWGKPSAPCTFTWTVTNKPPVIAIADKWTLIGMTSSVALAPTAGDPDNHTPLTFSVSGLPAWLTFDSTSNTISGGSPTETSATITVTVTDALGAATTTTFTWTVSANRLPVCSGAYPSQALWPPNHKMVPISILGVTDADPLDTITIKITGIRQDEPVQVIGSGATNVFDGEILASDPSVAWVRAERTGVKDLKGVNPVNEPGRIYEISFDATDGKATCSGMVVVGVPHDQGQLRIPQANPGRWNSLNGAFLGGF
jgi:putative Ig domain-containing protein